MKQTFLVSVECPEEADVEGYIGQAVACWCGSKDPADPIYDLHSVKVLDVTSLVEDIVGSEQVCVRLLVQSLEGKVSY